MASIGRIREKRQMNLKRRDLSVPTAESHRHICTGRVITDPNADIICPRDAVSEEYDLTKFSMMGDWMILFTVLHRILLCNVLEALKKRSFSSIPEDSCIIRSLCSNSFEGLS